MNNPPIKNYSLLTLLVALLMLLGASWFLTHPRPVQLKQETNVAQKIITNDKQKQVIVFFRAHCPYCEAATTKLLEAKKHSKLPVSFVNTRSNIGQYLVQKFGIVDASTIVVLENGQAKYYHYAHKINGTIQANETQIRQALNP